MKHEEIDYAELAARYGYTGGTPLAKLYKEALHELIMEGYSNPEYNPLRDDPSRTHFLFEGQSFILYSLHDTYVYIDYIYVRPKDRGKGVSKTLKSKLEGLVRKNLGWPRTIRATIVASNEGSLGAFKDYTTRSVDVIKTIQPKQES